MLVIRYYLFFCESRLKRDQVRDTRGRLEPSWVTYGEKHKSIITSLQWIVTVVWSQRCSTVSSPFNTVEAAILNTKRPQKDF